MDAEERRQATDAYFGAAARDSGIRCPECGSDDIGRGKDDETDADCLYCNHCGEVWFE